MTSTSTPTPTIAELQQRIKELEDELRAAQQVVAVMRRDNDRLRAIIYGPPPTTHPTPAPQP